MSSGQMTLSGGDAELRRIYGVSRQTATNWRNHPQAPGFPCAREVFDAFLHAIGSPAAPGAGPVRPVADTIAAEKRRQEEVKTQILEVKLARETRSLMQEAHELIQQQATILRQQMLSLANAVAPEVAALSDPILVEQMLSDRIAATFDRLATEHAGDDPS